MFKDLDSGVLFGVGFTLGARSSLVPFNPSIALCDCVCVCLCLGYGAIFGIVLSVLLVLIPFNPSIALCVLVLFEALIFA